MRKGLLSSLLTGLALLFLGATLQAQPADPGTVGALRWNAVKFGNHRYLVQVDKPAAAVRATIPWHRRDTHPAQVATLVVGPDGQEVANVVRVHIDQAAGELVFQAKQAGTYAIYYQPSVSSGSAYYPTVHYLAPRNTADEAWLKRSGADDAKRVAKLPQARVLGYQAVDDFDAYTDMERTAAPAALQRLLTANPQAAWLLFPETRANPIRMFRQVPARWVQRGAGGTLTDHALRGEYLSFQVGLWTARAAAHDVQVRFGDLRGPGDALIPAAALTCFNLGGIDYTGRPFRDRLDVAQGRVQPLWMGLDIPVDASPGTYRGTLTISAGGAPPQQVPLVITVEAGQAVAHGDNDPFKLSRLRWLNSTVAQNDDLVKPFTAVAVHGAALGILGRDVRLAPSGLPAQIDSRFDERMTGYVKTPRALLTAPMRLLVQDAAGTHALNAQGLPHIQIDGPGKVHWHVAGLAGPLHGELKASLEMDGTLTYAIALTAAKAVKLDDIRLEIPLRNDVAQYELGLGRIGSPTPATFAWKWNVQNNQDAAWIGAVNAGLEFQLRDDHYRRPLNTNFYHDRPLVMPTSWDNRGRGGVTFLRDGARYLVTAFSGPRTMLAGQTLYYDLVLRVTPFKPIKPAEHFAERYFQSSGKAGLEQIQAEGANVVNVHQGAPINPWINYPFLDSARMKAYVDAAHARGMKVKLYDTIRELSNRAVELPMLESLTGCRIGVDGKSAPGPCSEVILPGNGGGFSWLQEHLDGNYIAGWHVPNNRDAAVIDAGGSRWDNYYVEGVDWLARNEGIDGLYLDDVAFDRVTMMRLRKVLQAHRPDPLIDLHSANQFDVRDGYVNSALLYMGLFPYLDRLWFGEEFDYQHTSPAYWLTEISGIPYGLTGEMLQGGGNPWRGMLFGMTNRLPSHDPSALWKLWDTFGIEQADMVGWWVHDTPVTTNNKDVLATSYVRKGDKTLVALASWAPDTSHVKLRIDWRALGLTPGKVRLVAPAVAGFQPAAEFAPGAAIPVEPGKGWLLVIGPK